MRYNIEYLAACGKSRHRASPACSVAIVREGIGGILDVRWDIYRERPLGGLLKAVVRPLEAVWRPLGGFLGSSWGFSEASWALLGASSGTGIELSVFIPPLGPLLGLSGGYLGLSWAPLRPF